MHNETSAASKPRITSLLVLAIAITLLFLWMIRGFIVAIVLAAILASLLDPFYRRVARLLGGRKAAASFATVALSVILVIIPLVLFAASLVAEAVEISQSAGEWVTTQIQDPSSLEQQVEEDPLLRKLLPYQDEIVAKVSQLASKAGSLVANGLAAGAQSTAAFLLKLFVMLCALFTFLIHGRGTVDAALRFTPLTADDKQRLVETFASVGRATLKGTLVIGIAQGGLAGLAFWVAGVEGVLFWSVLMVVLSIIPGVGTALIWIPVVIYLFWSGQVGAAVGVALWCMIVVGTVDNVLRPLLVGKDTQMPNLLVLLTTLGGLAMFGAAGIILGPIIGALCVAVWQLWGNTMEQSQADVDPVAAASSQPG